MTLSITFYDNIKYGRLDFINRDLDFFGNGVVALTDFPLTFPATPNMTFQMGQGRAWVDGYRIANDSSLVTLTVAAASTQPRIDIVQIGHDDVNKTFSLMVKQGVPAASNPVEPGADPGYIKLYAIAVGANVTSITTSNITDRRSLVPLNVSGSQINYQGVVTTSQLSQTATPSSVAQRDASGNVLSAYPISTYQNPNLLFNPSGRLGLTGWTVANAGGSTWTASFGSGTEGGYYSVGSVTNAVPVLTSTKIPVVAGITIILSLEMLASGVTAGSQNADIIYTDSNGNSVAGGSRVSATSGTGWTKYSITMTVPTGAVNAQVRCFGDGGFTTTNSTWRKIKVEGGSYATTFSDDNTLNTNQYGSVLGLAQVLSGGYKEENGSTSLTVATAGTQVSVSVTFPTAFSSPPIITLGWNLSAGNSGYVNVTFANVTATGFTIYFNSYLAQSATVSWIAKGT